jgi:hypothetical protein
MDRLNTQHEEPMTTNSNRTLLIDDVRTLKATALHEHMMRELRLSRKNLGHSSS